MTNNVTMSPEEYLDKSSRTAPIYFNGRSLTMQDVYNLMLGFRAFIEAAQKLDVIKRHIFYGDEKRTAMLEPLPDSIKEGDNYFDRVGMDILHGVLGVATEAGELVECFNKFVSDGEELDLTNMREEIGDVEWYQAVLMRSLKTDHPTIWKQNIKKLWERFPDKFSSEDAIIRNLEAERKVLEENQ